MEAVNKRTGMEGAKSFLGTRRGAVTLAVAAAALAGILLAVFLSQYRSSVQGGTAPASVLVADRLIPKGTSGDVLISERLFKTGSVAEADLVDGALANAAALAGRVATRDIYPGQQLSAADFTTGGDPLRGKLAATDRAVAVPLDESHGLIGEIQAGDRVDVLAGFGSNGSVGSGRPVLRTLLQDVLVLKAPPVDFEASEGTKAPVLLRVNDKQAAQLAFAADNGKLWVALRPPAGASQSDPAAVSLESVLGGSR